MTTGKTFDVAVIGGGPAGMMAAGRAAALGKRVVLLEKNARLGEKLLITGGGRCNITNAQPTVHGLVAKYGKKGKALFSAFTRFGTDDTFAFFQSRGLQLKVEAEQRAFPVTDDAQDVWNVLTKNMHDHGVTVMNKTPVLSVVADGTRIRSVTTNNGEVHARAFIIATGGMSHPETGSTGDAFPWLEKLGIGIHKPKAALVPVKTKEKWVADVMGLSFQKAKVSLLRGKDVLNTRIGKILFTHFGLSGPGILNMSYRIGEELNKGPVQLLIDLFPTMDGGALDRMMIGIFEKNKNKLLKNSIGELFPPRLAPIVFTLAGVDGEQHIYRVSKEDRQKIGAILKAIPLTPTGLLGEDDAIITSGGAALPDIDFATMRAKKYSNLFIVGDMLDFERPSGGFSLQICWTTGWIAGESAAAL